jgi:hypothetical protein
MRLAECPPVHRELRGAILKHLWPRTRASVLRFNGDIVRQLRPEFRPARSRWNSGSHTFQKNIPSETVGNRFRYLFGGAFSIYFCIVGSHTETTPYH